jgi:hypothetical protein
MLKSGPLFLKNFEPYQAGKKISETKVQNFSENIFSVRKKNYKFDSVMRKKFFR